MNSFFFRKKGALQKRSVFVVLLKLSSQALILIWLFSPQFFPVFSSLALSFWPAWLILFLVLRGYSSLQHFNRNQTSRGHQRQLWYLLSWFQPHTRSAPNHLNNAFVTIVIDVFKFILVIFVLHVFHLLFYVFCCPLSAIHFSSLLRN